MFIFDVDPATLERNRRNWQLYHKHGVGDGVTIIMNEDGTHSAIAGDEAPYPMRLPAIWIHNDGDPVGPPIVARSVTTHSDGLVDSYTVHGTIIYSGNDLFGGPSGAFVWNNATHKYGDGNDWANNTGAQRWEYSSGDLGAFLRGPADTADYAAPAPAIRCWTIEVNNGVTGTAIYYKETGKTPVGIYKLGWFTDAGSKADWAANGVLPATLEVT